MNIPYLFIDKKFNLKWIFGYKLIHVGSSNSKTFAFKER